VKLDLLSRKHVRSVDHAQPFAQINAEDLAKISAGVVCIIKFGNTTTFCGSYAN
jgi:hypothetical protein